MNLALTAKKLEASRPIRAEMGECCGLSDPQQEKNGVLLQNVSAFFDSSHREKPISAGTGECCGSSDPKQEKTIRSSTERISVLRLSAQRKTHQGRDGRRNS